MPVYDFRCDKCGVERTETISIKVDDFKAVCACGAVMRKVFGSPRVKFNGSGFYTTDKGKQ